MGLFEMMPPSAKLPQLAKALTDEDVSGWRLEGKCDGHRILAYVTDEGVKIFARSGVDKTGKLTAVEAALREYVPNGTVLDGEAILDNGKGGDWGYVQSILGAASKTDTRITFVAFDVLAVMGEDVRGYPMATRRHMLEAILEPTLSPDGEANPNLQLIPQADYTEEAVDELIARGWEGAIIKNPLARYASGKRGHGWLKVKATETLDVTVMSATKGKGEFDGLIGALVFGHPVTNEGPQGRLYDELGQCSGMTRAEREAFTEMRDNGTLVGTIIEIRHMGVMPSGGLRHPQFLRVRTDKMEVA